MSVVIYTYQPDPARLDKLRQKVGGHVPVCQEMVPPPSGVRVHLANLVGATLKKPGKVVVLNFKELGGDPIEINRNAQLILQRHHTLVVESKGAEFKSPEEFDTYFSEFIDLMPKAASTVAADKRRRGPPSKMTPRMLEIARGLRDKMSLREIEKELKDCGEFDPSDVPSYKTVGEHLNGDAGPIQPPDPGEE